MTRGEVVAALVEEAAGAHCLRPSRYGLGALPHSLGISRAKCGEGQREDGGAVDETRGGN
jgi:hypothetical protein